MSATAGNIVSWFHDYYLDKVAYGVVGLTTAHMAYCALKKHNYGFAVLYGGVALFNGLSLFSNADNMIMNKYRSWYMDKVALGLGALIVGAMSIAAIRSHHYVWGAVYGGSAVFATAGLITTLMK